MEKHYNFCKSKLEKKTNDELKNIISNSKKNGMDIHIDSLENITVTEEVLITKVAIDILGERGIGVW